MSNMQFEQTKYVGDVQILKRKPFEGIPMTLDFTLVESKLANGKKVVKAGTPIGKTGVADNTETVVGILLKDVIEDRPQGTILKKAYINTAVAEKHSGITYADAMKKSEGCKNIIFE